MGERASEFCSEEEVVALISRAMRGEPIPKEQMHAAELMAKMYGMLGDHGELFGAMVGSWRRRSSSAMYAHLPRVVDDIGDSDNIGIADDGYSEDSDY